MVWALVLIYFAETELHFRGIGVYPSMDECFEAREQFMAGGPQPKLNYESVCVSTNRLEVL